MFGGNWGQNNQQQPQPQPQTNAFGQPNNAFGSSSTNAFGSTPAFGQPQQQQQQPQANPMFGALAAPTTSTAAPATGFGAFSGNTASTSAFGAKPATGFGAFGGGTGAFGGGGTTTNAFGQPAAATTTAFGQPATTTTTTGFGGGNSIFGGSKPTTGFGATTAAGNQPPAVTTGSANPAYQVTHEKDSPGSSITLQYQAISCMPAYSGYSFEELRVQDYAQGRKIAGTTTTAFGQPTGFGGTQPAAPTTGSSIFGQPAQSAAAVPSIFGSTPSTTNTTSGFGAFGGTNQPTTGTGTGLFGGGTTSNAFSQPQQPQQQQTSGFGAFGGGQQQQGGGLFGGGTTNAFSANATKPTTGFGAFGGTTGATGTTGTAFGGGNAFGQTQPAQQQQPTGGLFGAQPAAATTNAFGGFGGTAATNAAKPPVFGAPATTQPATTGFGSGLFGNNQQQNQLQPQQQPQQQSSLFGGGSSLFGATTAQQQQQQQQQQQGAQQPTGGLFGATTTTQGAGLFGGGGTGLLGTNTQQQQPAQQAGGFGGLFGGNKSTAPTGNLFGGGNTFGQQPSTNTQQQQGGGLFGGSTLGQSTNQQTGLTGGLFGAKPAQPAFGAPANTQTGGLFGNTLGGSTNALSTNTNAPAPGSLQASISQPIDSDLPIFSMLPPGPRMVNLDQQPKKKAAFFVDVPTRSPVPRVLLGYTPANSKLRGFSSSTMSSSSLNGGPFSQTVSFTSGKPGALALNKSIDNRSLIGPDGLLGRSSSPALGSSTRQSVKKVILDKKVEPTELFVKTGSPGSLRGGKVTFSPALSIAAREKEAAAALAASSTQLESPTPAPRAQRSTNKFTAQSMKDITHQNAADEPESATLEEGDYWVKPDLPTLKKAGYDQLSSFEGLRVGRVGYGEIHFLEPVDLTGLPKLGALLGEVVRFDDKECSVYPDSEDVDKPQPGSGLNVKARIFLERCWPVDKATREPIKDASHPNAVKHLKRLKNMKDTHFEGFEIAEGKWTFTVDHF